MDVLSTPSDRALPIPIVKFEHNMTYLLEKHSLIGSSVSANPGTHLSLAVDHTTIT
jgi:hypothetical protein